MDIFNAAVEFVNKAGTVGLAVGLGYALWKRHLVLGWQYDEKSKELETCQMVNTAYSTKTETRLEKLETERDKRNAIPS